MQAADETRSWLRQFGWPLAGASTAVTFGLLVRQFDVVSHLWSAGAVAAGVGFLATPEARPLLRRLASGQTGWLLPVMMVCSALALVLSCIGLQILVPVACAMWAIHIVVDTPSRRRLLKALACTVLPTALALLAQRAGWADGLVPVRPAALVGGGLLTLFIPAAVTIAHLVRRAQEAADALEAERRLHILALEKAALHDPLTGLLSRRGLMGPLAAAAAGGSASSRSAVLFVDLDRFKHVNDVHGHRAGDELLVVVAQRMLRVFRSQDFVARTGGDEFVVILPALSAGRDLAACAERVRRVVCADVILSDGTELSVGASIGVAVAEGPEDQHCLLDRADAAMYVDKRARARLLGQRSQHLTMAERATAPR